MDNKAYREVEGKRHKRDKRHILGHLLGAGHRLEVLQKSVIAERLQVRHEDLRGLHFHLSSRSLRLQGKNTIACNNLS